MITQLEVQLESEQADVDKLTKMSLAILFYTILRSKEEQLEAERQQALAAAMKLQEAKQALSRIEAEFVRNREELTACQSANASMNKRWLRRKRRCVIRHQPLGN
jgi:hypothetical protein